LCGSFVAVEIEDLQRGVAGGSAARHELQLLRVAFVMVQEFLCEKKINE
jgi:hypothetical protein